MERMVCYCKKVSESQIVKAIKNGANSLKDIQVATSACTGSSCKDLNPSGETAVQKILQNYFANT